MFAFTGNAMKWPLTPSWSRIVRMRGGFDLIMSVVAMAEASAALSGGVPPLCVLLGVTESVCVCAAELR